MMAVVAISAAMSMRLVDVALSTIEVASAQSIADACALAAVTGGRAAAEGIARSNDAVLVDFDRSDAGAGLGSSVHVVVDIDGTRAEAWASDDE